jgi:hypothetical protein
MPCSTVARHDVQRREKPRLLMWALAALALAQAVPGAAQEATEPSPIEHALVEYLCRTVQRPAMIGTDAYQSCYASQLALLRAPFGRNLANLTAADRKSIDGTCGDFQATRGRDAYLSCLNEQLVSIRDRRGLGTPVETALVAPPAAVDPIQALAPPAPVEQPSSSVWWWIAGVLAVAGSVGSAALVVVKRRTVARSSTCRGCGTELPAPGDLCADCRHDAAEARRRALAERAEEERLQEEQRRQDADLQEEVHRQQLARQDEMQRARDDEKRRQEEERERRLRAAREDERDETASEFDPYVVLGVDHAASAERIRSAYQEGKARYDARQYEHLGSELQEHFRAKAAAVERAYLMLVVPE